MKVNANLADVSTKYVPIADGDYEMKVVEVSADDSGVITVKSVVDEPGEEYGKPVWDRINFVKNDGTPNKWAMTQTKKYFEAIAGEERANSDDLDWDEIKNGRFRGVVETDTYTPKSGKNAGKETQKSVLSDILPL